MTEAEIKARLTDIAAAIFAEEKLTEEQAAKVCASGVEITAMLLSDLHALARRPAASYGISADDIHAMSRR